MSWITITDADLASAKMAPLLSALRSAAVSGDQPDPVDEITLQVVDRIRRKIAACTTNRVDVDTSKIPQSLKGLACRLIIQEAKGRLEIELTEQEREQWRVDERELTDIAMCKLPIETPEDAIEAPVQQLTQRPSITKRRKEFGRADQEGA